MTSKGAGVEAVLQTSVFSRGPDSVSWESLIRTVHRAAEFRRERLVEPVLVSDVRGRPALGVQDDHHPGGDRGLLLFVPVTLAVTGQTAAIFCDGGLCGVRVLQDGLRRT